MQNLIYRFITALLLLPMVLVTFFAGGYYLAFLLGLVSLASCLEAANIIYPKNNLAKLLAVVFWAGLFLSAVFAHDVPFVLTFIAPTLLLFNVVFLFTASIETQAFEKLCTIFYCSFYVTLGIGSVYWLQNFPEYLDPRVGLSFILLGCICTWGNDTCAYFGGRLFGRHPLFKRVSGKKTWEGFFSGALLSVVIVFLFKYVPIRFGSDWLLGLGNGDLLWIALPSIILAPLGDLIESRLKRVYDIKDASNILPGHGGLLDRIDALLLVMPWTALYAFIIRPV